MKRLTRNVVAFLLGLLLSTFLIGAVKADTLDFLCCSYHADREANYNERNYGLFYARDNGWLFGAYKNSEYNTSVVIGGHKTVWDFQYVDISLKYGIVTGYTYGDVLHFVLPEITIADRVSLHFFPSIENHRYEVGNGKIASDKDIRMNWALSVRLATW